MVDLKGAYKQLPASPLDARFNFIAAWMKEGRLEYFRAYALMFGVTAAVYAFLRFSRAIVAISRRLLVIPTVEFFDDFTLVQPRVVANRRIPPSTCC